MLSQLELEAQIEPHSSFEDPVVVWRVPESMPAHCGVVADALAE